MPRLSDSMEEGTILRWLKQDGDKVAPGDELAEIETDKATMTYEAEAAGVLRIVAREGDALAVGQVIATLGEGAAAVDGAVVEAAVEPSAETPADDGAVVEAAVEPSAETPAVDRAAVEAAVEPSAETPADDRAAVEAAVEPSAETPAVDGAPATGGEGVRASPVARRVAREKGIDLATVQGTGPGGRIVRGDVEGGGKGGDAAPAAPPAVAEGRTAAAPPAAAPPAAAPPAAAPPPAAPPPAPVAERGTAKGDVRHEELFRTQQVVARRMAESRATVPDFTIRTVVDMEQAVAARAQLKAAANGEPAPSFNDLVVKACAIALRESPRANGAYRDGRFELYSRVNVGIAVATEDALIVPTIFDADRKGLAEIARDARALAERVRSGAITPPELSGGTFTVSNLGMFGVTDFAAVINPPQAAILAVGSLEPRAVVRDGELVARHTMGLTLTCDHRILYGADAASFLARIRALLEAPMALAL